MRAGLKTSMDDSISAGRMICFRPVYFKNHVPKSSIESVSIIFPGREYFC